MQSNDILCTITEIQGTIDLFYKYGYNFLMRQLDSFGPRRKMLGASIIHKVFQAEAPPSTEKVKCKL